MQGRVRTRLSRAVAVGGVAAAVACGARTGIDVPVGLRDGGVAAPDVYVGRDVYQAPPPGLDCAEEGVTYIYLIDEMIPPNLYAFHPDSCGFDLVGVIDCPDESSGPFSMAVDHRGVAYSVYGDGNLFRISTKTAACEPTGFVPNQHGIRSFGMGFVANVVDGGVSGETLYVAGDRPSELATVDLDTFVLTPVGPLGSVDGIPITYAELTGTAAGGLFAFFGLPNPLTGVFGPPSYIVHVDPRTGIGLGGVELPDVVEGQGWAFGFWGGDYYTFTAPPEYGNTTVVTRYRPSDGSIVQLCGAPEGVVIVGAGVSTCAPQQ